MKINDFMVKGKYLLELLQTNNNHIGSLKNEQTGELTVPTPGNSNLIHFMQKLAHLMRQM